MRTDVYVLDASVAAKWYLNDERYIEKARLYLIKLLANEIELHAPVLLQYEMANLRLRPRT